MTTNQHLSARRRQANDATFVIIKPDAIRRGLIGAVLSRLEPLQLEIIGAKVVHVSRELAKAHYHHLKVKPFFNQLLDHLQGKLHDTPYVLAFVLWGPDAIARVRQVAGATHPEKAEPMSIRGSFGRITKTGLMENILHASTDQNEAEREIRLWFKSEELLHSDVLPRWVSVQR